MKTIWKYLLPVGIYSHRLYVPEHSSILDIQVQDHNIYAWIMIDTSKPVIPLDIITLGTGHETPEIMGGHIATVQLDGFVWHLFYKE